MAANTERVGETKAKPAAAANTSAVPPKRALDNVWTLDDLEALAQRYLPKCVFAWSAGGSERFISGRTNQEAFEDWAFQTRILQDCAKTTISTVVFGKKFDAPFGISPMGGAPAVGMKADLKMGMAATRENIPFMISGGAGTTWEDAVRDAPNTWPQFYAPSSAEVMEKQLDRVIASGADIMVLTIDIPVPASAVHSQRLGWSLPIRLTKKLIWDGVMHPSWLAKVAIPGFMPNGPRLENMHPTFRPKMFSFAPLPEGRAFTATWADFEAVRRKWDGTLVIKGIINPADARRAIDLGADAVMVSNHGARQIDYAYASLRALPAVVAAAGDTPVFIDSGFRRGTHVMMALALGAKFVFIGRPFLFAAALGGEAGVRQAIGILKTELHRNLALLGCADIGNLNREYLIPARSRLEGGA
jgi:L-lactate dehydrogenase (cytochrome)